MTPPKEDIYDLIAGLSYGGFLSDRITCAEAEKKVKDFLANYSLKADGLQWVKADIKPDFDGEYLCDIEQTQECGNVWKYYGVRSNAINNWVIKHNETVIRWAKIPPPDESGESSSKITELEKEIERLKEVMWNAFLCDVSDMSISRRNQYWQQFTKDNNL